MTGPLSGLRVIDLTVVLSGTYTTMALADLGAEVIRVESRHHYPSATKGPRRLRVEGLERIGNTRRGYAERDPGDEPWHRSAIGNVNGRGKRSVTMELETDAGRSAFDDLVRRSDVLVENNSANFLERRGLSAATLFGLNRRLVLVRLPGGAPTGALASIKGMGPSFEALAGLRDLRRYPDVPWDRHPETMYMDATTGPAAVAAVLSALRRRRSTGEGASIVVSQLGVMMDHARDAYAEAQAPRRPAPPRENFSWEMAPHGVYRCAGDDEWLALACEGDEAWRSLHRILSASRPTAEPPLGAASTLEERLDRWRAVDDWVTGWTSSRTKHDAFHELQGARVAAAPVLREGELMTDEHMNAVGAFTDLDHPVVGRRRSPGPPWSSSRWRLDERRAAPLLGEDNEYVYREVLGYDDATYRALIEAGEVGTDYV
jgi:crotonobetainyl-CoA:carnitine CoA-transferase CaiB-like acyl-CoA transferase